MLNLTKEQLINMVQCMYKEGYKQCLMDNSVMVDHKLYHGGRLLSNSLSDALEKQVPESAIYVSMIRAGISDETIKNTKTWLQNQ